MALRDLKDCAEEALVPRAGAIRSSLLPSATQRRMSSMDFLSETPSFVPARLPLFAVLAGGTLQILIRRFVRVAQGRCAL